jgi:hypothetical protein
LERLQGTQNQERARFGYSKKVKQILIEEKKDVGGVALVMMILSFDGFL